MEHHNWKLIVLLLWSQISFAAIGSITELQNNPASIQRNTQNLPGNKGTGVESLDVVKTTAGKAGITFQDDTRVQINENSKLTIDDFVYDPNNKKAGKLAVKVALGTVRYASGQIAKNNPQNVAVNTPSATIAVRGTDFTATVDELGRSTIILLPSCPADFKDIATDCKTGKIEVITDEGKVLLDQPFQATRVDNRGSMPIKPVILNLDETQISNILILSPPKELREDEDKLKKRFEMKSALDLDFLAENKLVNVLEQQQKEVYKNKLDRNFLDNNFLENILDQLYAQMQAELDALRERKGILPDYNAKSGVQVELDDIQLTLCREGNGDVQCITTPRSQSSTIIQNQGVEIKNRVNQGGNTFITVNQN